MLIDTSQPYGNFYGLKFIGEGNWEVDSTIWGLVIDILKIYKDSNKRVGLCKGLTLLFF